MLDILVEGERVLWVLLPVDHLKLALFLFDLEPEGKKKKKVVLGLGLSILFISQVSKPSLYNKYELLL